MGRIKKSASDKHEATLPPVLSVFIARTSTVPAHEIPSHLETFPEHWPFPRGDLYHWIPVLDRFDELLDGFVEYYKLHDGPQTISFGCGFLESRLSEGQNLDSTSLRDESDRKLVESILQFSRLLIENCGNRSLYDSSERLHDLLNTTSLSLLLETLRLASRLAVRYYYSRARSSVPHIMSPSLLTSHFNIDLDRVQKLADPFDIFNKAFGGPPHALAQDGGRKGKEKAPVSWRPSHKILSSNDFIGFMKDDASQSELIEDFGTVALKYYLPTSAADVEQSQTAFAGPSSPTVARRASGLSKSQKPAPSTESSSTAETNNSSEKQSEAPSSNATPRSIIIPNSRLMSQPLEEILHQSLPDLPKNMHYDFLNRLRVAKALTTNRQSRIDIVETRILAVASLAYIYPEKEYQTKLLRQDAPEPRRLQIVTQLADIVRPGNKSKIGLPLSIKTSALTALEAICKHKFHFADVCSALQVNVNHGIIFQLLQESISDLAREEPLPAKLPEDDWREALFLLLSGLPSSPAGANSRTAETLIGAGLFELLVKLLELRTARAERAHSRVLAFIMAITHGTRDSLQTYAANRGFDVISDLVAYEVGSAIREVQAGRALPEEHKSQVMDYEMPFFQQQTLRGLFKLINSMLTQQGGNVDRLIRNLIDSPQLLTALREVIQHVKVFGSNIWSGAISIVSSFIHSEPTSYAVIMEAGLSKAILEAISLKELEAPASSSAMLVKARDAIKVLKSGDEKIVHVYPQNSTSFDAESRSEVDLSRPTDARLAPGILPATDTIVQIPQAFGAMCLNTSGEELFLTSGALDVYFEIFESPAHVKSLASDPNTAKVLGSTFDELMRHHERLRNTIIRAIVTMIARVNYMCRMKAVERNGGVNLWVEGANGVPELSTARKAGSTEDTEMTGTSPTTLNSTDYQPIPSATDHISAVASFLVGFCENASACTNLIHAGGVEFILDLATSPSLPHDFTNRQESTDFARVLHMLIEHKPHLVLPSVIVRTQQSLEKLEPFMSFESQETFFSQYLTTSSKPKQHLDISEPDRPAILKALVEVHTLCNILQEAFAHPILPTTRAHHTLFSQVNLTDYYVPLVKALGKLHRVCLWEEILLQRILPDSLKKSTKPDGIDFSTDEANEVLGIRSSNGEGQVSESETSRRMSDTLASSASRRGSVGIDHQLMLKNAPTLRYLLSQIPLTITPFLQGLGRSLVPKRRFDQYLRQNAYLVADAIAEAAVSQLQYNSLDSTSPKDRFAYLIVVLTSVSHLIVEGPLDRPHSQCLTLILQAFKKQGGLRIMNSLLNMFFNQVSSGSEQEPGLISCALGGMKIILVFYSQLVHAKHVVESIQSQSIQNSERDRDRNNAYYFSPHQFLVDLRVIVISAVKPIWDSSIAEKSSIGVVKSLIDILRVVCECDHENGVLRRGDPTPMRAKPDHKPFNISSDKVASLTSGGISNELAREACFRCLGNREFSEEYANAHQRRPDIPRLPIPFYEQSKHQTPTAPSPPAASGQRPESTDTIPEPIDTSREENSTASSFGSPERSSTPSEAQQGQGAAAEDGEAATVPSTMDFLWTGEAANTDVDDENGMAMSIDNILNITDSVAHTPAPTGNQDSSNRESSTPRLSKTPEKVKAEDMSTLDELNDLRASIRSNLMDQVLEMLSAHEGITFDLSDLIITAASKAPEAGAMQKEVGGLLVQSLVSFMEDDFRENGKKVASYANLLAIMMQQKDFYDAALEELRDNFENLVDFIKVFPEPNDTEPSSPWIAQVLLVLEKLLAEDVQPQQIKWTPPTMDAEGNWESQDEPIVDFEEPGISTDDKSHLFEAILNILPRIGKDEALALSVVRVLAILSRERVLADQIAKKPNLQRLFVMVKQLAGITDERFHKTFMLILRHIVEDDDTIREVMRAEVATFFKPGRSRQNDTTAYVRHMAHLVIRSPSIFLEITNEKLKLQGYDSSQRPQYLVPKEEKQPSQEEVKEISEASPEAKDSAGETVQPTTENADQGAAAEEKPKSLEAKTPTVENPDGITHWLLSQLLSYKDVEDKEFQQTPRDTVKKANDAAGASLDPNQNPAAIGLPETPDSENEKKADRNEYQAEQHPIFNYRCFILQCLTELLMSYRSAKVEFINFSSKADPKVMTPSKPRSGVLTYLLARLIPYGTLEKAESITEKKRVAQSNWAMCVVVALSMKPNHRMGVPKEDETDDASDNDLLFVRKFVLENALKVFKDASVTDEPLDIKYGRLLSLADLFARLLFGRVVPASPAYSNEVYSTTNKEIARLMFEKNYISTLTNAIADVDLLFPNSRRAVKYILRPLKSLTEIAIDLSQNSEIFTTPGQSDEDNISTASSVSEIEVDREETPDLFRNSTLGMLEPGREQDLTSEGSDEDEDMYDDEYGEEMDYEEEVERDGDEVVSDVSDEEGLNDDEAMEGLPGDTPMDVEVIIDDEDDDDEDPDDDEDSDDDELDSDDDVEEILDINGDDENDSLGDNVEDEWEDEADGDEYDEAHDIIEDIEESREPDDADHEDDAIHNGGPMYLADLLGEVPDLRTDSTEPPEPPPEILDLHMNDRRHLPLRHDEEEDDEDEEDEEADDEEVAFEPDYDDDGDAPPWGWDPDDEPAIPAPRHHHHGGRHIPSPWRIFPPGADRGVIEVPGFRQHARTARNYGPDDGTNPLLQRSPTSIQRHGSHFDDPSAPFTDLIQMFSSRHRPSGNPISIINSMMAAMGGGVFDLAGPGGLHLQIGGGNGTILPIPGGSFEHRLDRFLGNAPRSLEPPRIREDSSLTPLFYPSRTARRWLEEAHMLFGVNNHLEKTQKIVNALLKILVPPALEEDKIRKQKEREEREKREAERKRQEEEAKAEEERRAKQEAEMAALMERTRQEQEAAEREAAERAAADAPVATEPEENPEERDDAEAMEGVETLGSDNAAENQTETEEAQAGSSTEPERVRATFRGREVDITGLGIDLEYLNALPDELREEVLMQQLAEQRSQAAVTGEAPTEISPEFLNALPPDIREEILQQEAQDRRRREREEQRRQAAANGTAPPAARAEDMDTASFLASLDPALRNAVLLEQDEEVLAQLPASIAAEARALGADRLDGWRSMRRDLHRSGATRRAPQNDAEQAVKKPKRQVVQMLDKAGVATLLRLLFVSQQGSGKDALNQILKNISQNRQNRAEVLSLLLSILQEGSMDLNAIEKSFMHLSIRAKQQQASQKPPQPLKRSSTGPIGSTLIFEMEMTPATIIQQCLSTLVFLTAHNMHVPSFFLTENENAIKGKAAKKGKGKENRASKFALNSLLNLLDRPMILDSAGCMEQLSTLLQSITHPLTILQKKDKDKNSEENPKEAPDESNEAPTNSSEMQEQTTATAPEISNEAAPISNEETTEVHEAGENEATTEPETKPETETNQQEPSTKKQRNLVPPVVPDENLRLVVSVLAARECSAKTFRDIVSTISNLSAIPGTRETFGKELIQQAQDLGNAISQELDELIPQIKRAEDGADVQGAPAMNKFAAPSSNQAKLLRVLTALDYLFDPKRGAKAENNEGETSKSSVRDDILGTLYESSTFGPLWIKLSECLTSMKDRGSILNLATILLPLIESLMVVCKNTTLKDSPAPKAVKDFAVTSPPPESGMEGLFFRFTEDHRKILNELVRHNPRLMSGTFALLVKNPKVLEFDNKRNYFTRRLHSRTEIRQPQPPLQLNVRRDQVFMDSFRSLYFKTPEETKYGKLSIRFHGEEGVDAGGVTREWFQVMSRQMFNADYALFTPVASDRTTFHPNKLSHINQDHLMFFKFVGRVIGKALYEGRALDCHFSRAVYKKILGRPISVKDMETLDLDYYKSLLWMLENDISDIITETFSIENEAFGVTEIVDLIENGRNIAVTEENKQEYVQLVVEYKLTGSVKDQLDNFLKGFQDIVSADLISIFNEQELELLISGLPDIDVDDWKNHTDYHNYNASAPQIQWFWRAVRSFDKEERAKLLQFVTGTSKVPLNGFKELEGMNGFSRFNIHRDYGNEDRLPSSHTCFNQLDLPVYENYETLRQRLYTAMTTGGEYFGFA